MSLYATQVSDAFKNLKERNGLGDKKRITRSEKGGKIDNGLLQPSCYKGKWDISSRKKILYLQSRTLQLPSK